MKCLSFIFVWAYISCTEFSLWYFHTSIQCNLTKFTPFITLSYPLPLSLKYLIIQFSYMCMKYFDHIHSPLPSPFALPPPTASHSHESLFYITIVFLGYPGELNSQPCSCYTSALPLESPCQSFLVILEIVVTWRPDWPGPQSSYLCFPM
jgi:hypothetical protein